jgi:hypothetical protein
MQSGLEQVHRPTKFGDLRVLGIYKFSHALQLRWLWQSQKSENKLLVRMEIRYTKADRRLFIATTKVTIENGAKVLFWRSAWLHGIYPNDLAPTIFALSKKKSRTVQQAVAGKCLDSRLECDTHKLCSPNLPVCEPLGEGPFYSP